ncbi:hypothetical protein [Streptomyces sp. NPDC007905]|uniref:hypothetical protein n=1 Tax=Streptomyces sp. NPDC007905 TaxID=3364788 RepID=UPI0036EBBBD0
MVDMIGGGLYRVDVTDGSVPTLTRWHLSPDGTEAYLTRTLIAPALQIPTTRTPGALLVVRSQFDKGGPMGPETPPRRSRWRGSRGCEQARITR